MNWKILNTENLCAPYTPARAMDGEGGGGGTTPAVVIPQPMVIVPLFKSKSALAGYIAMNLFINTNFDTSSGPAQAAKAAVVNAMTLINTGGDMFNDLCAE